MGTGNPGGGQGAVVVSLCVVVFSVVASATYLLSGKLTNDAPDLNSITTLSATLLDTTSETTLANHTDAGPFADTVMLVTGDTYELKLDAIFNGILPGVMGTKIEDVNWQFTFGTVPEPNSVLLFGVGAMCVAGWYIRRYTGGTLTGCQP